MTAVLDKQAIMRDKRAQGIAAMGLVNREGDRFRVTTPALRGRRSSYEVWRDDLGRVRCSCLEFEEKSADNPVYRCEHILAVKHAVVNKTSESITKQKLADAPTPSIADVDIVDTIEETRAAEAEKPRSLPGEAQTEPTAEEAGRTIVPLTFTHTLRLLRQPVEQKVMPDRKEPADENNPKVIANIEWNAVADLLDRVVPTWSYTVRSIIQLGEIIAVTAAISIDGVTREGVGTGVAGDASGIRKAEHEALKDAAVKFGIARDLYGHEIDTCDQRETSPVTSELLREPRARSVADMVTPKQLGMIRALGREINTDIDDECQKLFRCQTDELSKRAASSLINHLALLKPNSNIEVRRAS